MAFVEAALGTGGSPASPHDHGDVDRLLAGYRAARAQEGLFDLRPGGAAGPGVGYDEFVDETGNVRPDLDRAGRAPSGSAEGPGWAG